MEFAELPGSSPCLNPKQHSEECICFNHCPADLNSRLQSQAHRELTHVLLPRVFFSKSEFTVKFLGCNTDPPLVFRTWDGPSWLQCATPEQDDIFQCQKKNGEVFAVEIVREVPKFQTKELKKHARLKESWHIRYRKNLRWMTGHRFLQQYFLC